ncbi:MAG: hypothetical protein ACOCXA_06465 [Planctomycetota bacterium]
MHINLHDGIGSYDLAAIYDRVVSRRPSLHHAGVDADTTAQYVIGQYFCECLRDQVLVAMATGARVLDISIHPLLLLAMAHHLHRRAAVRRGETVAMHRQALRDGIIEVDLHHDPGIDPLDLVRHVAARIERPEALPKALAAETEARIWSRIEDLLTSGAARIHMLLPATAVDVTRQHRAA